MLQRKGSDEALQQMMLCRQIEIAEGGPRRHELPCDLTESCALCCCLTLGQSAVTLPVHICRRHLPL